MAITIATLETFRIFLTMPLYYNFHLKPVFSGSSTVYSCGVITGEGIIDYWLSREVEHRKETGLNREGS